MEHRDIMNVMESAGYKLGGGLCAGLTAMWVQAALLGNEEEEKFFKRFEFIIFMKKCIDFLEIAKKTNYKKSTNDITITSWKEMQDFFVKNLNTLKDVDALKNISKSNNSNLYLIINRIRKEFGEEFFIANWFIDVQAFFDGIILYQKSETYGELLQQSFFNQEQIEKISKLTASMQLEKRGYVKCLHSHLSVFDNKELKKYLYDLKIILQEIKKDGQSIPLIVSSYSAIHCVGLRYEDKTNGWLLFDANLLPDLNVKDGYIIDDEHIIDILRDRFELKNQYMDLCFFACSVGRYKNNKKVATSLLELTKKYPITKAMCKQNKLLNKKKTLLQLALAFYCEENVKQLIEIGALENQLHGSIEFRAVLYNSPSLLETSLEKGIDMISSVPINTLKAFHFISKIPVRNEGYISPLELAIHQGSADIIEKLLSHILFRNKINDPNIDWDSLLNIAKHANTMSVLKKVLGKIFRSSSLEENVKQLIKIDALENELHNFIGFHAVLYNSPSLLEASLEKGIDIISSVSIDTLEIDTLQTFHFILKIPVRNEGYISPLELAIHQGSVDIIEKLLSHILFRNKINDPNIDWDSLLNIAKHANTMSVLKKVLGKIFRSSSLNEKVKSNLKYNLRNSFHFHETSRGYFNHFSRILNDARDINNNEKSQSKPNIK